MSPAVLDFEHPQLASPALELQLTVAAGDRVERWIHLARRRGDRAEVLEGLGAELELAEVLTARARLALSSAAVTLGSAERERERERER